MKKSYINSYEIHHVIDQFISIIFSYWRAYQLEITLGHFNPI